MGQVGAHFPSLYVSMIQMLLCFYFALSSRTSTNGDKNSSAEGTRLKRMRDEATLLTRE